MYKRKYDKRASRFHKGTAVTVVTIGAVAAIVAVTPHLANKASVATNERLHIGKPMDGVYAENADYTFMPDDGVGYIYSPDGNVWLVEDPPIMDEDCEVRVLFHNNGTEHDRSDDKIIDITERE